MKIKFTLQRSGGLAVDLLATVDATTTVGELAAHLAAADPLASMAGPGHGVVGPQHGVLTLGALAAPGSAGTQQAAMDPQLPVGESALRSGGVVALTRGGTDYADPQAGAAAIVTVTAGPDTGREFGLHRGTSVVGRERGCEVYLNDPLVSRQHARISITDVAEIVDLGSANGVQLGQAAVSRAVLRGGDPVRVGDTELSVRVLRPTRTADRGTAGPADGGATVGVVRSPRLDPRYAGVELDAPEPPQKPQSPRFPYIALVAPLLMGVVLYLITRSLTALAFVALSPMMIIGYAVESALAGRAAYKRALQEFRADVELLTTEATAAAEAEVLARNREHPPVAECVDAVRRGAPLLWTRRPADPGFAELRLGIGPQPSRNTITLQDARRAPRALHAELVAATEGFATAHGVPVVARPAEHGAIGLAGSRQTVLDAARAVVTQLAATHSPAEVVIAAFASSQTARDWDWLKWLPHTTSAHSPLPVRQLATAAGAGTLISELEDLLARRTDSADPLPAVFVLVEDDAPVERSRLVELAEHGWPHGIHVLWLAADVALLPAACRTYVALRHGSPVAAAGFVHNGEGVEPVTVELVDAHTAVDVARRLAPLVDTGARVDDDSDLPRAVSLLTVPEPPLAASSTSVIERWIENRSIVTGRFAPRTPPRQAGTLRAVIGKSAAGAHALDLRADGPHALVGGTTGSGKSELLQAWILAMAAAHSPQRLTFLLVDYKGGSAFKEFETLPHNIGLVTDLDPHRVRRALISLAAELKHREKLFHAHGAKDLVELEKKGAVEAPPSLVIVVDEFAALVKELPEFVDGVVNVAQRGRSLGVHLILATQRPAGVIKENLRANTNLRLALRTADEADSTDVLGSPEAAFFDPALPGRAVSKTGPGRLVPFQVGYAGGWTTEEPPPPEIVVEELHFGAGTRWEPPTVDDGRAETGPTDIQRLVGAIRGACADAGIEPPRRPWLPDLRPVYDLSDQLSLRSRRRDDELVFGVRDEPQEQRQPVVAFRPDVDGNLAVFGTGGSGKSTLLRTLAIAAGFTINGGPCHVYGLDFGARGLAMLEELPHVGAIVSDGDHERVWRLIRWLRDLVDERAVRFSRANAGTITEYRHLTGAHDEPRILLLLDGVAAFRQGYEVGDRGKWFDMFVGIANDGRPVGVHVLLSADRVAAVPSALGSAIQTRVMLRMADVADYGIAGVPADVLTPSSPPGRGLLRGAEIQVAMLGTAPDVGAQSAAVRAFARSMTRAGVVPAPPILRLAEQVPLVDLPASVGGLPVLGLSSDTLAAHTIEPRGSFLVTGAAGSGRTTALHTLAVALRRWDPAIELHFLGGRGSTLAGLDVWTTVACGVERVAEQASLLANKLPGDGTPVAVIVENLPDHAGTGYPPGEADAAVLALAKACAERSWLFVGEGESNAMNASSPLLAQAKLSRAGLVLAPDSNDGTKFGMAFPPRLTRADFPPGRAMVVRAGQTTVVQLGLPD